MIERPFFLILYMYGLMLTDLAHICAVRSICGPPATTLTLPMRLGGCWLWWGSWCRVSRIADTYVEILLVESTHLSLHFFRGQLDICKVNVSAHANLLPSTHTHTFVGLL